MKYILIEWWLYLFLFKKKQEKSFFTEKKGLAENCKAVV